MSNPHTQAVDEAAMNHWISVHQKLNPNIDAKKDCEQFLANGNRSLTKEAFISGNQWCLQNHPAVLELVNVMKVAASAPGVDWLEQQVKLAEAIENFDKTLKGEK